MLRDRDLDATTRNSTLYELGEAVLELDEDLEVAWAGSPEEELDEGHDEA